MFFFLHNIDIGRKVYQRAKNHYLKNGLQPIGHGNTKRLPSHGFTTDDLHQITFFLSNYSEANAILLPGRIPGYKRADIQLLPAHMTKRKVWEIYIKASATLTFKLASYRTFCRVWKVYKPLLVIVTPKSDLCWTCQKNSLAITESANKSDEEKMEVICKFFFNVFTYHHNPGTESSTVTP